MSEESCQKCSGCYYFEKFFCLRYPPKVTLDDDKKQSYVPYTDPDSRCGEYRSKLFDLTKRSGPVEL